MFGRCVRAARLSKSGIATLAADANVENERILSSAPLGNRGSDPVKRGPRLIAWAGHRTFTDGFASF